MKPRKKPEKRDEDHTNLIVIKADGGGYGYKLTYKGVIVQCVNFFEEPLEAYEAGVTAKWKFLEKLAWGEISEEDYTKPKFRVASV